MVDPIASHRWLYRALYALVIFAILFVQVMPATLEAGRWPGPDLILAVTLAWALRRPDFVPPLLAGVVLLTADLLLQRPPGLWAALVVAALEVIRARNSLWRDLPFLAEWAVISVLMAAVVVLYWLVLAVFMVNRADIGLYLIGLVFTALSYPPVVVVSTYLFGVRKPAPGAVDALGHPL